MTVVRTTQRLRITSTDPVAHNPRGNPLKNTGFNFIVTPNDKWDSRYQ
jgi:hypothetical protein